MNALEWPARMRSARQKKRLVKTDRDKQLIQLHQRREELWQRRRILPMVPLAQPYQRGWKRIFVLRDDIRHSLRAEFYQTLLAKINTVEFHHDPSFKRRKRRKKRYYHEVKPQLLREFTSYSWNLNRINLSEQEQACFTTVETFNVKTKQTDIKYVFAEPWRYVLKVFPNMVTHVQLIDVEIERELAAIDRRIKSRHLAPRIDLLIRGRGYCRHDWFNELDKYTNKIKNIAKYRPKDAYLALEI